MPKILLVEDEEVLREAFSIVLSTIPYESDTAADGSVAIKMCQNSNYDLIFLDLMMPSMNGVDFLEEFAKSHAKTKIIIMSNLATSNLLEKALNYDVCRSILKSDMSPASLIEIIYEELGSPSIVKT